MVSENFAKSHSSSSIARVQELAKNNKILERALNPDIKKSEMKRKSKKQLLEKTKNLQNFYNEKLPSTSVVLIKPDSKDPVSIPLSRQNDLLKEKSYKEIKKMALIDLENAINTETQQNNQQTDNDKKTSAENTTSSTLNASDNTDNTRIVDLIVEVGAHKEVVRMQADRQGEKVSPTPVDVDEQVQQCVKRRRGRPRKAEKLSQATPPIPPEKLSQDMQCIDNTVIDDVVSLIPLRLTNDNAPVGTGKTSLTYLSIYSNSLTPQMLDKLFSVDINKLPLTISEVMALKLMKSALQNDEKSSKMYWDLTKTLEKNKKPQQIKKTEATLLERKLAEAKSAILVEKPIDDNES